MSEITLFFPFSFVAFESAWRNKGKRELIYTSADGSTSYYTTQASKQKGSLPVFIQAQSGFGILPLKSVPLEHLGGFINIHVCWRLNEEYVGKNNTCISILSLCVCVCASLCVSRETAIYSWLRAPKRLLKVSPFIYNDHLTVRSKVKSMSQTRFDIQLKSSQNEKAGGHDINHLILLHPVCREESW